jgi:hypothetical protein
METAQFVQSKSAKALFANGKAFVYSFTISHDIVVFHTAAIVIAVDFAATLADIHSSIVAGHSFGAVLGTSAEREYHTQRKQQTNKPFFHKINSLNKYMRERNKNAD